MRRVARASRKGRPRAGPRAPPRDRGRPLRKKKHPEHENHERWLVSYADFITLLFAFFVVMFAVSQVDSQKMGRFVESVNVAFEYKGVFPNSSAHPIQGGVPEPAPTARASSVPQKATVVSGA